MIGKYDINKAAYFKAESRLVAKKEDLFKNPNLNKWDIAPEDLKQVDKTKLTKDKEYAFKFMMSKVIISLIPFLTLKISNFFFIYLLGNSSCVESKAILCVLH